MFKIGQKVVCKSLKTVNDGYPFGISKDGVYTVLGYYKCKNCGQKFLLLNAHSHSSKWCGKCDKPNMLPDNAFWEWRFEPIKYALIDNMEIIKEIITERSDVPIKEPKPVKKGAKAF